MPDGSECLLAPIYQVGFTMRIDMHHPPSQALTGLSVCEAHRVTLAVDDVLSTDGWELLMTEFDRHNKQRPFRRYTELTFQEI
jgi:hypothetical protein